MKNKLIDQLSVLLADTYALYLKTQNYHWHVKGLSFKALHELFEEQYIMLANAVDGIAERIVTLGGLAPASFSQYMKLTSIKEGDSQAPMHQMIVQLHGDHQKVINDLNQLIKTAQEIGDEGTIGILSERLAEHEKIRWMLGASMHQ